MWPRTVRHIATTVADGPTRLNIVHSPAPTAIILVILHELVISQKHKMLSQYGILRSVVIASHRMVHNVVIRIMLGISLLVQTMYPY